MSFLGWPILRAMLVSGRVILFYRPLDRLRPIQLFITFTRPIRGTMYGSFGTLLRRFLSAHALSHVGQDVSRCYGIDLQLWILPCQDHGISDQASLWETIGLPTSWIFAYFLHGSTELFPCHILGFKVLVFFPSAGSCGLHAHSSESQLW